MFHATLLLLASLHAGAQGAVPYVLRSGSSIRDDCLNCDRPLIEVPLEGGFLLEGEGNTLTLSGIDLRDGDGRYIVTGTGVLVRSAEDSRIQDLTLTVEVNGTAGIELAGSGEAAAFECWPAIDESAGESGARDPLHIYTIRLVAAPAAAEHVLYDLVEAGVEGSYLVHECLPCGRPTVPIPIAGTLLLAHLEDTPFFTSIYRVEAMDFRNVSGDEPWAVGGWGCYRQGGHLALTQEMDLAALINGLEVALGSGKVEVPRSLPEIDVPLRGPDPLSRTFEYQLRILARPRKGGPTPFRRGDVNADASVDISDPISVLAWRFSGGDEPACLESADANDDGAHDVSDAVYLLLYLFQDGPPPPAPGPEACGPSPDPGESCLSHPPC